MDRAEAGPLHFAQRLAIEIEDFDLSQHVDEILSENSPAEDARPIERALLRGNDFRNVLAAGLVDIHGHDSLRWRI